MKTGAGRYAWSSIIAVLLTALMLVVPSPGYFFAPGMLAGAILFPQGAEGDSAQLYLVVAAIMNMFVYSWVVFGVWLLIERARRRN